MKKLILIISSFLATSCIDREKVTITAQDGQDGTSCVLKATVLDCGGVLIDLAALAVDGAPGRDGLDGASCVATAVEGGVLIECGNQDGVFLAGGLVGPKGDAGTSCYVDEVEGGAIIWCEDGSSVFIKNGKEDDDGEPLTCAKGKTLVCHTTPAKPKNLCVAAPAVPAFISVQGGYLGQCK